MLKQTRAIPTLLIVINFIAFVIIPNISSTLNLICDFALLARSFASDLFALAA